MNKDFFASIAEDKNMDELDVILTDESYSPSIGAVAQDINSNQNTYLATISGTSSSTIGTVPAAINQSAGGNINSFSAIGEVNPQGSFITSVGYNLSAIMDKYVPKTTTEVVTLFLRIFVLGKIADKIVDKTWEFAISESIDAWHYLNLIMHHKFL